MLIKKGRVQLMKWNVLIACEETQRTCNEFLKIGINAYSADIQRCRGGNPSRHILGDVIPVLNGGKFYTQDGTEHYVDKWDLMIGHPPCTYLARSGSCNLFEGNEGKIKDEARNQEVFKAREFFMTLYNADIEHICLENPVPMKYANLPQWNQIIEPYMFGDNYTKATCLWLKNLPPLKAENYILKEIPKSWCSVRSGSKYRSETFKGIAKAFAEQYTPPFRWLEQCSLF